ncbi:hypothetical protein HZZ09_03315 [Acinetobacter nosocomialis]|nr:hypothetical protein [Acinetobacter nosocomialis]
MIMIRMIIKPLDYIKITWKSETSAGKSYNAKKWVDIYLPLLFSTTITLVMIFLLVLFKFKIFFTSDSFSLLTSFLQTLPGFYIAALAAIVSFNSPKLDEIDFSDSPIDINNYNMSFRRFLTNTFAYLAWISIFLILFCLIIKYIFESISPINIDIYFIVVYSLLLVPLMFFVSQLFSITAMSLFYLGDRIHRK